jgi:hypothetical protein
VASAQQTGIDGNFSIDERNVDWTDRTGSQTGDYSAAK